MPAIRADNLTRSFGDIIAVDRISFEVARGEVFGCLGHNGAGKTTTVRLMNGVLQAHGGQLQVLGFDPHKNGYELRRRTGVLTEAPALDARLTARENLSVYANLYEVPQSEVTSRVDELLEHFGLAQRAEDKIGGYSKGMQQRLALVRALIHQPELLFLDEPTAGLDPMAARGVHELIIRLRQQGTTIFLCTHNLVEAQKLCDRVAVLERGTLLGLGTIAELSQRVQGQFELEIEVDEREQDAAADYLRQELGADKVRLERGYVICTMSQRDRVPGLLQGLVQRKVAVYRLSPQEPSLEDIYFGLHPQEEGR